MDGVTVYFDLNDNIDDLTRPDFLNREADVLRMADCVQGPVWDLGCNIGQFAIPMSTRGCPVTAFDISPRACLCLRKTAEANHLPITVVNQPVGMEAFAFAIPGSARPTESTRPPDGISSAGVAMPFPEAVGKFGVPRLVKMDIEGAEAPFFQSLAWRKWILEEGIYWIIEFHPHVIDRAIAWTDVPSFWIDEFHGVYHRDEAAIERIRQMFPTPGQPPAATVDIV
jgi:FkbM family methyltransferase